MCILLKDIINDLERMENITNYLFKIYLKATEREKLIFISLLKITKIILLKGMQDEEL